MKTHFFPSDDVIQLIQKFFINLLIQSVSLCRGPGAIDDRLKAGSLNAFDRNDSHSNMKACSSKQHGKNAQKRMAELGIADGFLIF
ncbi:hypothetical protein D3M71_03410 [Erwinia billingiae]|nr:hypothetical protein [Erwinia billingiae]